MFGVNMDTNSVILIGINWESPDMVPIIAMAIGVWVIIGLLMAAFCWGAVRRKMFCVLAFFCMTYSLIAQDDPPTEQTQLQMTAYILAILNEQLTYDYYIAGEMAAFYNEMLLQRQAMDDIVYNTGTNGATGHLTLQQVSNYFEVYMPGILTNLAGMRTDFTPYLDRSADVEVGNAVQLNSGQYEGILAILGQIAENTQTTNAGVVAPEYILNNDWDDTGSEVYGKFLYDVGGLSGASTGVSAAATDMANSTGNNEPGVYTNKGGPAVAPSETGTGFGSVIQKNYDWTFPVGNLSIGDYSITGVVVGCDFSQSDFDGVKMMMEIMRSIIAVVVVFGAGVACVKIVGGGG